MCTRPTGCHAVQPQLSIIGLLYVLSKQNSGSFKVTHLGMTGKPSRACISCVYILDILFKVSELLNWWTIRKITIFNNPTVVLQMNHSESYTFYFLETRVIDLHFIADSMCLPSINFSGGLRKTIFFCKSVFRPFRVPIESAYATSY